MKHGVFAFSLLLAAGVVSTAAFVGCSSSDNTPAATEDTGVADTGTVDTGKADTGAPVDMGPVSCQQALPTGFACMPPTDKAGAKVCTDAMLTEFMNCFGTTGDSKKCTAAMSAYKDCNKCVLTTWLANNSIDVAACIKKIAPTDPCATTVQCTEDCLTAVCSECDDTPGSGRTSSTSEKDNCYSDSQFKGSATRPKGKCYDIAAKDYAACAAKTEFSFCFVRSIDDVKNFFRGACRDNGDWTKADQPDGTETMGDGGVTDTGTATDSGSATDSSTTDSGSAGDTLIPDVALGG